MLMCRLTVCVDGAADNVFFRACLNPDCVLSPLRNNAMWIANGVDEYKPITADEKAVNLDM
jgi:hypothetical protein